MQYTTANMSAMMEAGLVVGSTVLDGKSPKKFFGIKTPQPLTRKRVVDCNPPVGKKKSRGQGSSEPKSVSPKDRVSGNGHLFCNACREEISL